MGKRFGKLLATSLFGLVMLLITGACASDSRTETVWPGETWQRSTPEAQGVDSQKLLDVLKLLRLEKSGINSMVIIRNGYIITEYYRAPYERDTTHRINSCTKSFTSTLMGIAIDEGIVRSVHEPIMNYFPEYFHHDSRVNDITIQDALTMRSGFEWHEMDFSLHHPENSWRIAQHSSDSIGYLFSQPIAIASGKMFNYNTVNTQLLMDIIYRETDGAAASFADSRLFTPLGIDSWGWAKTPAGSPVGGTMLVMTTGDLARLGYLYLHEGKWNGKRIVSKKWIQDSISPHTPIILRGRVEDEKYGYQWWILDDNCYAAEGGAGQRCYVLPEYNTVVAVTSSFDTAFVNQRLLVDTIIRRELSFAIISDDSLVENRAAMKELETYLTWAGEPVPMEKYSTSDTIISLLDGNTVHFEKNDFDYDSLTFKKTGENTLTAELIIKSDKGYTGIADYSFMLNGEYSKKELKMPWVDDFGDSSFMEYYRLTSIRENSLSYEIIDSGSLKLWHTFALTVENGNVTMQIHRKKYDAWTANIETFSGRIIEDR